MENNSVTTWIRQFSEGDQKAASNLWNRYRPSLITIAKRRFRFAFTALADEEDLIQSVFKALWRGASQGKLDDIHDREQLWWLLLRITKCRALSRVARDTRKKRRKDVLSLDQPAIHPNAKISLQDFETPPPDLILMVGEEQERLLGLLPDDDMRAIVLFKLDGYTHDDIATKLNISCRTVIRKMQSIRRKWAKELDICATNLQG